MCMDKYDLHRNPHWPFKPGAAWIPRGYGCSWAQFLEAIDHKLNGAKWVYLGQQLWPYVPIIERYGNKLNKLLGDKK